MGLPAVRLELLIECPYAFTRRMNARSTRLVKDTANDNQCARNEVTPTSELLPNQISPC